MGKLKVPRPQAETGGYPLNSLRDTGVANIDPTLGSDKSVSSANEG